MADIRHLAAMRRFMTPEEIKAAYQAIFQAWMQRLDEVTIITGKSTEGESAQAQVVVDAEHYAEAMDALEVILNEIEGKTNGGNVHISNIYRYTQT